MTRRILAALLLAMALILIVLRLGPRGATAPDGRAPRSDQTGQRAQAAAEARENAFRSSARALGRDLLHYSDEAPQEASSALATTSLGLTTEPPPRSGADPRLIGFIHVGAKVRAVLVIHGALEVLALRQEAEGFVLVGMDVEGGTVRLKKPSGDDIELQRADS